ncbi:MAG: hypothetical protein ABR969_00545 [Sedimentisphaerales bacterium]|jgi:hypothetical protein
MKLSNFGGGTSVIIIPFILSNSMQTYRSFIDSRKFWLVLI